jgi:hypothetical protein
MLSIGQTKNYQQIQVFCCAPCFQQLTCQAESILILLFTLWMADGFHLSSSEFLSVQEFVNFISGPPSLLSNGYQGLFPWGVKRPGREADHSPQSSAKEVKNAWSYTSAHPIHLHGVVLSQRTGTPLLYLKFQVGMQVPKFITFKVGCVLSEG